MPPLQRVETPRSQASWWSDRNPMLHLSPTINIHAAAKPLMKFLYHRQALGIMEDNGDSPLSVELLDIYSSYLSYQYVAPATRIVVLQHLERRVRSQPDNARAILHSSVLDPLLQLLTIERFRMTTYPLVSIVLAHGLGFEQMSDFIEDFKTLLYTNSQDVYIATTAALTAFPEQPGSTTAIMIALLHSQDKNAQRWVCTLIERLARRDPGFSSTIEPSSFEKLVNFLNRDSSDGPVIEAALSSLTAISEQADGAATIVATDALQHLTLSLKSTNPEIRFKTCAVLSSLAKHEQIVGNILRTISIGPLLDLFLHDEQPRVRTASLSVLVAIAAHPDGAAAVVEARTLDHLTQLLRPGNEDAGCLLLTNLRAHIKPTIQSNLVDMLFELSSGQDDHVAFQAISELVTIAAHPDRNQATSRPIVPNILARLSEWFKSPRAVARRQACTAMESLAGYHFALPAIIRAKKMGTLSDLLCDQDTSVASAAMCAINRITEHVHPKILASILTAKMLDHLPELLGTKSLDGGYGASVLLANLRKQKSGVKAMLRVNLVELLFGLFSGEDPYVTVQATSELIKLAEHPDARSSASAILSRILQGLISRLESPLATVRRQGCELCADLATHESVVPNLVKAHVIDTLSNLLRDEDVEVINGAMHALIRISEYPEGAAAIIAANVLDHLPALSAETNSKAYILLTTLKKHNSALPPIVWTNVVDKLTAPYTGYLGTSWVSKDGEVVLRTGIVMDNGVIELDEFYARRRLS